MTEIREIRPEDHGVLAALWQRVFGDPAAYVETFFRLLPELGSGVTAVENGAPVGAAYVITALELREPGRRRRCAYLYAVAVDEPARGRGLGGALSRAACELGRARGAELIATLPAEPGLYAWYEQQTGLRVCLRRSCRELPSAPGQEPQPLSAAAYFPRREALLEGRAHLSLPEAALRLEEAGCRCAGGGLYALGGGVAAAYVVEGVTVVRELLGAPPEAAAALGAALGTERVRLWTPDAEGEPYLALSPADLPPDTVWNLAFD